MRVSVFGLGYVGTVFAASLAYRGINVIGVDIDISKVKIINCGKSYFYEPGLEELIRISIEKGLLKATTNYVEAVKNSEVSFIMVGTPSKPNGSADLRYVELASQMIGKALREKSEWHLIVVRSTVPPGTTINVVGRTIERITGLARGRDFGLAMNPEFTREGSAIHDILHPSRIVIGELDKRSGDKLLEIYKILHGNDMPPVIRTSIYNAELAKYAANAFLAMKISFINLIARIAEHFPSSDVRDIAKAIGLDPRIGLHFLGAGLGFGGPCLPKDVKALIKVIEDLGEDPALFRSVLKINDNQPKHVIKMGEELIGSLKGKRVAILGLAFKPNTDDIRESQALKLVNELLTRDAEVIVYDPVALNNARHVLGSRVMYASNVKEALKGADLAIIATEWKEFRDVDPDTFKKLMRIPAVIDARRIYEPSKFISKGILFKAVGLGDVGS